MKTLIAALALVISQLLLATEEPTIAAGDYLLVYAQIVNCGSGSRAIEAQQVNEAGLVRFFEDQQISAHGRRVQEVRGDLVDALEEKTGRRSKTLNIVHLPGNNPKLVATRLFMFSEEVKRECPQTEIPPDNMDPERAKVLERMVRALPCPVVQWSMARRQAAV